MANWILREFFLFLESSFLPRREAFPPETEVKRFTENTIPSCLHLKLHVLKTRVCVKMSSSRYWTGNPSWIFSQQLKMATVWDVAVTWPGHSGMLSILLWPSEHLRANTTIQAVGKLLHSICWYLWIYDLSQSFLNRSALPCSHETF